MNSKYTLRATLGLLASAAALFSAAVGQTQQAPGTGGSASILTASATTYTGVAAGDAFTTDAVLWTRVDNGIATALTAQVSTDTGFAAYLTFAGTTAPGRDNVLKLLATGLQPGTRYYYRFVDANNVISPVGTFKTAPATSSWTPVHFGFSGDADGLMRPYPSSQNFPTLAFDFFVWLGDTIYETASGGANNNSSPAVADAFANPTQALIDYHRKYREQFLPVSTGSFPGLKGFFAAQGNYTLNDNHELGNKQFINGGAPTGTPAGAGVDATNTANDVNTTGTFINQTTGFKTLQQAYFDYQPLRERTLSAPTDPRSDGTPLLYFAQQWGANSVFINVDDRSYRDIRLKKAGNADDTGPRADNANRTMLGQTELQWLEQTLSDAQTQGVTWKIVAVSSPIDQIGAVGSGTDGGKSWIGGYRAERDKLFKYLIDNHIDHVVFLTTDDHQVRINELTYPSNPPAGTPRVVVPGALCIVAGPLGATGPDGVTNHDFSNIKALADSLAATETTAGVDPIGLSPNYTGLFNVVREGDASANMLRQAVDFYSPDTFNYATLDVSADGRTLSVKLSGINSYATNTFPQPDSINKPVRDILSFQIQAQTPYPLVGRSGFVYDRRTKTYSQKITITNNSPVTLNGPISLALDNLSAGAMLANQTGLTGNVAPLGVPYIVVPGTAGGLAPGAVATVTLQFTNTGATGITYNARIINNVAAP